MLSTPLDKINKSLKMREEDKISIVIKESNSRVLSVREDIYEFCFSISLTPEALIDNKN